MRGGRRPSTPSCAALAFAPTFAVLIAVMIVRRGGDATSASLHALLKSGAGIAATWALVALALGTQHLSRRRRTAS